MLISDLEEIREAFLKLLGLFEEKKRSKNFKKELIFEAREKAIRRSNQNHFELDRISLVGGKLARNKTIHKTDKETGKFLEIFR